MNFAIGASGLMPKAFNLSSGNEEKWPQLKHSTAIRFMPFTWASNDGLTTRLLVAFWSALLF
jgi:hypothetical protein